VAKAHVEGSLGRLVVEIETDADSDLVLDEVRNTQMVGDVTAALARGRNCLVLTRRVAHVEILASLLSARGHEALVLQGGMSATLRRAAVNRLAGAKVGEGVLVIGTTPFIGEGFDAPALDTLFLAAPVSFAGLLIQCAGRVIRAAPGKDVADVHDYHDPHPRRLATASNARVPRAGLHQGVTGAILLSRRDAGRYPFHTRQGTFVIEIGHEGALCEALYAYERHCG
jgi:superfamily II DNA or RNA helicase